MNVSKFMKENESIKIQNIHSDIDRSHVAFIGNYPNNIELFFKDLNHLKQFVEQLNAQIEEIEK